ncbi:hypothetical protein C8R45DRAFT_931574 [Mycena sanguinolenta]|nr:hypothetical protein C8R45DRAFT_931574 [Mycena sanguinolenta]
MARTLVLDIDDPVAAQLEALQQHNSPPDGLPRGYIRLAVMDGKNTPHQRVIWRQQERGTVTPSAPTLRIELNPLGDLPGNEGIHTFKAGSTYCLQTIQWACGHPIGWGSLHYQPDLGRLSRRNTKLLQDCPTSLKHYWLHTQLHQQLPSIPYNATDFYQATLPKLLVLPSFLPELPVLLMLPGAT